VHFGSELLTIKKPDMGTDRQIINTFEKRNSVAASLPSFFKLRDSCVGASPTPTYKDSPNGQNYGKWRVREWKMCNAVISFHF